jgi:Ribbon-helix-helix protein, copG family
MSDDETWEPEEVEVTKPVGVVISVRFPQNLAEKIYAEAKRRAVPTSAVIRAAVEAWLNAPVAATTHDVSISSSGGPVAYTEGMRSTGTAGKEPKYLELDGELISTP